MVKARKFPQLGSIVVGRKADATFLQFTTKVFRSKFNLPCSNEKHFGFAKSTLNIHYWLANQNFKSKNLHGWNPHSIGLHSNTQSRYYHTINSQSYSLKGELTASSSERARSAGESVLHSVITPPQDSWTSLLIFWKSPILWKLNIGNLSISSFVAPSYFSKDHSQVNHIQ